MPSTEMLAERARETTVAAALERRWARAREELNDPDAGVVPWGTITFPRRVSDRYREAVHTLYRNHHLDPSEVEFLSREGKWALFAAALHPRVSNRLLYELSLSEDRDLLYAVASNWHTPYDVIQSLCMNDRADGETLDIAMSVRAVKISLLGIHHRNYDAMSLLFGMKWWELDLDSPEVAAVLREHPNPQS